MARPKSTETREQVSFRMLAERAAQLDELCEINHRSRRDVVEILIGEAYAAFEDDPTHRVNPL